MPDSEGELRIKRIEGKLYGLSQHTAETAQREAIAAVGQALCEIARQLDGLRIIGLNVRVAK